MGEDFQAVKAGVIVAEGGQNHIRKGSGFKGGDLNRPDLTDERLRRQGFAQLQGELVDARCHVEVGKELDGDLDIAAGTGRQKQHSVLPGVGRLVGVALAGGKLVGRRPEAPVVGIVDGQQLSGDIDFGLFGVGDGYEVVVDIGCKVEQRVGGVAGGGCESRCGCRRACRLPSVFYPR